MAFRHLMAVKSLGTDISGLFFFWPQQLMARFSAIAGDEDFLGCSGIEPFWMVYGNLMGFDG